jgi:hypothetical protein
MESSSWFHVYFKLFGGWQLHVIEIRGGAYNKSSLVTPMYVTDCDW